MKNRKSYLSAGRRHLRGGTALDVLSPCDTSSVNATEQDDASPNNQTKNDIPTLSEVNDIHIDVGYEMRSETDRC